MSYNTAGLSCLTNSAASSIWLLKTVDSLASCDASGYVTDAGPASSGKGAIGRGMKVGDIVHVMVVDDVTSLTPSITAFSTAVCTAVSGTTGAGTLLFDVTVTP